MLNVNDIKLLNRMIKNEDDLDLAEVEKVKSKISLVCEQIEIQEEAQIEMAKIQDKIVSLNNKVEENENEEK